jgi:DNA-binding LacI/PurR family transcriptional regulator
MKIALLGNLFQDNIKNIKRESQFVKQFFAPIMTGILSAIDQNQRTIDLFLSKERISLFIKTAGDYDGFLVINTKITDNQLLKLYNISKFKPGIFLLEPPFKHCNSVTPDSEHGIKILMKHIQNNGITNIGFIGDFNIPVHKKRIQLMKQVIKNFNLKTNKNWILHKKSIHSYAQLVQNMKGKSIPEVFMFPTAAQAISFYDYITRHSDIKIPDNIGITGFNSANIFLSKENKIILTTALYDFRDIGYLGITMLEEILTKKRPIHNNLIHVQASLYPGSSVCKARYENNQNEKNTFISDIKKYINWKFNEANLSQKCSIHFNFNHKYFLRKFKTYLSISFNDYVNDLKITRAAFLLKNSKKTITEIYFEIGYNSYQSFTNSFKKKYRLTPKSYRLKHKTADTSKA